MAKILTKNSVSAGSAPSGLSFGELAVNVTDKKLFVGNAVGGVVTLVDPNALVTSVNGATGAITDVARTNQGNTFSVRQVMNAGITTANLYVTSGATFISMASFSDGLTASNIYASSGVTFNSTSAHTGLATFSAGIIATDTTDGIGVISTKGALNTSPARNGAIRLGYVNSTSQYNTLLNNASGLFTIYNGFSTTGSNLLNINSTVMNVNVPVSGMTFSGNIYAPNIVTSFNGITGAVGFTAGSNITITQSGNTFTISSSGGGGGGSGFTYASSAPGSPAIGDRWIDSDTGKEYVYVNDGTSSQWIEPVSSNGLDGLTYTSASKLYEFGGTGSFVKLGIGITAPQYTLHVVGDSNFTSGISAASIRLSGGINGVTASFTGSVSSDAGYQITSGAINAQTGTTYSLLSNDNGKILTMNNGSSTTVTIPSGLPIGYNTTVIQLGAGQVGFTGSGTTINSAEGKLNIGNRYSAANIISYTTNTFILAGGLTG